MRCHVFLDIRPVVHPILDRANNDNLVGVFTEWEHFEGTMNALRHAVPHALMEFSYRYDGLALCPRWRERSSSTISSAKLLALWNDEAAIFAPALRVLEVFSLNINLSVVMPDERLDL